MGRIPASRSRSLVFTGAASVVILGALAAVAVPRSVAETPKPAGPMASPAKSGAAPADRRVFFGEMHLHTTMSFDAWTFGTKVTPDQAYKFARGEPILVSAAQVAQQQGVQSSTPIRAQRAWPLDFAAVTDHSEYLGAVAQLEDPNSPFSQTPFGKELKTGGRGAFFRAGEAILGANNDTSADLRAAAKAADGWNVEMRAANENYQPGKFTTLLAYEWTSTPGRGVHMHRNVFFDGDRAPAPFTAVDSNRPEDLWTFMEGVRKTGQQVLAIPHNSNLSDGLEFDWNTWDRKPIDKSYALRRALNEPLVEIAQAKGASETTPDLSPNDEFANFEVMERIYAGETSSKQHGSYVREGWGRGLQILGREGANPFKMGVVGASDIHNGLSVSDEAGSGGSSNGIDPRTMGLTGAPLRRALGMTGEAQAVRPTGQRENDPLQMSSAAITGVWAESNTRASIFAALKRRETFATSGTRIKVRMFGGWRFTPATVGRGDWLTRAYAEGAPMGGDLPPRGSGGAPNFVVQAMKDPTGANLDRIQIVKVWLAGSGYREKVFDVALSGGRAVDTRTGRAPAVGDTVDPKTGAVANTIGAAMLSRVWTDPEFDPKTPALYYARVLEIPTPRWSTRLALRNGTAPPKGAPMTLQERAWTSPIWYAP